MHRSWDRRRTVICSANITSPDILINALDKALGLITKHIQKHERSNRSKGHVDNPDEPQPGKLIKFEARSAGQKVVKVKYPW